MASKRQQLRRSMCLGKKTFRCESDALAEIEHPKNKPPAQTRMFPKQQGTCLHCRRKITANTSKEWSKLVKSPCPHCGRPGW